ncbi:oligosaccharyl transferase subunit ost3/OST6 [Puccinia graminis f. sp. tritici]|uniref:Oligosaccharyl transferase subunit ost3/OST6 n=1 Tax=Puccinia graminis f. sp. tritici TaxID=56615 RepID=A0A5B0RFC4_PUCGR|nr:oligosaccharyl transferase subunit ost3/OST6 [Puccinia graminis f. sp. tritici]KAA1123454.1 oligosaccharyl transferase subunit ost3/OST6 [Puccinia graminis f. sp. tritici]
MTFLKTCSSSLISLLLISQTFFQIQVQSATNNDPLSKLIALTKAGKGVAPLNDKLYDEIISGPRNFSVTVVLTALGSQFQCQPCQIFDLEYQLLARQWAKQPTKIRNTHFFAMLDFKEGKNTFTKLGLNTAPQARTFLANEGPEAVTDVKKQVLSYDFNKGGPRGLTAELFSDWAINSANLPPFFKRPPNYGRIFAASCILLATIILIKVAWPLVKFILTSRFIWAAALLPVILLMISGQMWCQIRSPPYMVKQPNGAPSYIAGGYSNQYGVETQVIASLYGVLAFAAYTLAFTVSKLDDPIRQRVAVYVWLGVFLTISSMLLNIFRMKNSGYPFKLFL